MTVSRASRPALGLLLLALAAGAAASRAEAAQLAQGQPIQLVPIKPRYEPAPQPQPAPGAPSGVAAPAAAGPAPVLLPAPGFGAQPAPAASGPPGPKGIEVDKLGGIDVDGLGTLDPGHGGLGMELWRGTSRSLVARLIPALPAAVPSPALRALAHRLLLSTATPPQALAPDGRQPAAGTPDPGAGSSLIALRARKLAEMGDLEGLHALSTVIPARLDDEALARLRINTSLLEDDPNTGCTEVPSLIRSYHDVTWQKLQIFCQALARKSQQVDVGLGLLHEEGEGKDQAFFSLVDALMGVKGVKVTSLPGATPLLVAMMRAAKQPLPDDVLRGADPAVLRAVATSVNASADLRLGAAERAAMLGAVSGDELAQIYDKQPLSDDERANALSRAQAEYGPRARILLYRAAKGQSVPTARAEALRAALTLARSAGVYGLAVTLNLPLIQSLTPVPELGFFADEAVRALLYAGQLDAAQAWLGLAHQTAGAATPSATDAATVLWPFTRLAAVAPGPWDAERFAAWRRSARPPQQGEAKPAASKFPDTQRADSKLADDRAAHLLGLFAALGDPVAPSAWQLLYTEAEPEPAAMPSVAVWQGLKAAAAEGRRGETVLLALIALGASGPVNANPIALDGVIDALRRVGLEADARRLAIEGAIAAGI